MPTDKDAVIRAMRGCKACMAISVGKTALPVIGADLAKGLLEREKYTPGRILDMILAENMRSADLFFREKLREELPPSYPWMSWWDWWRPVLAKWYPS